MDINQINYYWFDKKYFREAFNLIKEPDEDWQWVSYWNELKGFDIFAKEYNLTESIKSEQEKLFPEKNIFLGTTSRIVCLKKNEASLTVYSVNYDEIVQARYYVPS